MPRQFDIVENLNPRTRLHYPLLVVLQHDRVASLRSMIAAPLVPSANAPASSRLHPSITIGASQFFILTEELAAVPPGVLGAVVGSAEANRYEIIAALDLLFTGI